MNDSNWIAYRKARPHAQLRLFCFPYAGGSAAIFRGWAAEFPDEIEVVPIQPPGREGRLSEPPITRMQPFIEAVLTALRDHFERPFALFGHSMGALVCFELARRLRREGLPLPERLFVSGRSAPQLPDPFPHIHHLPPAQFLDELARLGGTPAEVLANRELMEIFTPLLRADLAVNETYHYEPEAPLACPISAFGGKQDREVPMENIAAWHAQTCADFVKTQFPGDHFFINSARTAVIATIKRQLARPAGK